jgi:DNA-directed RNA polymerase specialized sigma24 family protein
VNDADYAEFVRTAWQRHLRLALLLTGDRLHAEELLQDCLVRMYVRWHKLVQREDLPTFAGR